MGKNALLSSLKSVELVFLLLYAVGFYYIVITRSFNLANEYSRKLVGLRQGWIIKRLNDLSDSQWRNFRGNLPILAIVFSSFTLIASIARLKIHLRRRGMSIIWSLLSLCYITYLHGVCVVYVIAIAATNFFLVKAFAQSRYFPPVIWSFNILILLTNRIFEGYPFSMFGQDWAFLDDYRGNFRWHICFNLVILRMISFGHDFCWAHKTQNVDDKIKNLRSDKYSFLTYLCYLTYAPLYIAGPIISFDVFSSQLDEPKRNPMKVLAWYFARWFVTFLLMECVSHFFYYNAFVISGLWMHLSPFEVFIIGYGVLNFMWLKFYLIWRFFRFWALIVGIEAPENMPRCINNCYSLEGFWKCWHASFNKWLVRYMYIPLGGAGRKLLNVWVIFTFVAIWHDLEWKLISWAWLTCLFFVPEIIAKSVLNTVQHQVHSAFGEFVMRELSAVAGAITLSCLMIANLVGYVVGPQGIDWLVSGMLSKDGLPTLYGILFTFYLATKLMFHIDDANTKAAHVARD